MRFRCLILSCFLSLFVFPLGAQDVHYTLHNYAPLWLNPANTGSFSGSIRAGGVYRGQWYSISGINSPTAYADAPLAFGFRKQDWVGVGFSLVADQAGDFNISSTFFGFSGAYHLALDKRRTNVLTIGAQYGSTSFGLTRPDNFNDLVQGRTQPIGQGGEGLSDLEMIGMQNMGGMPGGNQNNNFNDLNAGVKVKLLLDKKKGNLLEAGVSVLHLNAPRRMRLLERNMMVGDTLPDGSPTPAGPRDSEDARRRRPTIHAHARLDLELSEKWRFQPTAFFQSAFNTSSISLQAWGQRALKNDLALRLGLGYRTADAAKVMFGIDAGQLRGALAYDITLSQARNPTSFQGAFELGLAYIFNIYKKPEVKRTILCPDI